MSIFRKLFGKKESRGVDTEGKTPTSTPEAVSCAVCGKNIGTQWNYSFESILLATTVGAQCPECGRTVCDDRPKIRARWKLSSVSELCR